MKKPTHARRGMTIAQALATKVDQRKSARLCWVWLGSKNSDGYGQFRYGGKMRAAHRVALEIALGSPIPFGLFVLHGCDNRACCNPGHLRIGTPADNVADRVARKRTVRGERHHFAKVTSADVAYIRRSKQGRAALARMFSISPDQINNIRRRKSWK